MTSTLLRDALAIGDAWLHELDLHELVATALLEAGETDGRVDVVAIGKAAREMAQAAHAVLGARVDRQLLIVDEGPAFSLDADIEFVIGDHPRPGLGSLMAGERLVAFLKAPRTASCTLFLISGGASSLCALPQSPTTLAHLGELFTAALEVGADITALNKLRAASSCIAGGAVLRHVRTRRSLSLVMVDNVVSGERWVASALTFEYAPDAAEVDELLDSFGQADSVLGATVRESMVQRAATMRQPVTTAHENRVLAEPSLVLAATLRAASRRGFRTVDLGSSLHGDLRHLIEVMEIELNRALDGGPVCVVGVGEVTVKVTGEGTGGRCQEFVWRMAEVLERYERESISVARATDGRDYVRGIAGGWVDGTTVACARARGIEWSSVVTDHDSFHALNNLEQLIEGGRTGWNLCDIYMTVVGAA